jgi:uncharacterized protein with GYD domain
MPTYIVLHELSGENIEKMRAEMDAGLEVLDELDCERRGLYLTFGRFEAVGFIDAPDAEAAAQFVGTLARDNDAGTETLRAFSQDQAGELVAALPQ